MEEMPLYARLLLIVLFIAGNAFFVSSEIAISSARRSRIRQLAEDGDKQSLDHITGIVAIKELLTVMAATGEDALEHVSHKPVGEFARPPFVVPNSKLQSDLLKDFKRTVSRWPSSSTSTAAPRG